MAYPRLCILGVLIVAGGCATTAPPSTSGFRFVRDGSVYTIVAGGSSSEPANDPILVQGAEGALHARDRDQDGRIDTLLAGAVALSDADAIYAFGLKQAQELGLQRVREPPRTFVYSVRGVRFVVWSLASGGEGWSNRFARYTVNGDPEVFDDADADGRLDGPGADDEAAQRDYERALDAGIRDGRIDEEDSHFYVLPTPSRSV